MASRPQVLFLTHALCCNQDEFGILIAMFFMIHHSLLSYLNRGCFGIDCIGSRLVRYFIPIPLNRRREGFIILIWIQQHLHQHHHQKQQQPYFWRSNDKQMDQPMGRRARRQIYSTLGRLWMLCLQGRTPYPSLHQPSPQGS